MKLLPVAGLYAFVALFCAILIFAPTSSGCGGIDCKDPKNASSTACTAEAAALDCSGGSIDGALALWGPEIEQLIETARGADGSINWASIESSLTEDVYKYGSCVVGAVFGKYFTPTPAIAQGSGMKAHGVSDQGAAAAKAAFERVRAKAMAGRKLQYKGQLQ